MIPQKNRFAAELFFSSSAVFNVSEQVEVVLGDLTDALSLEPFFTAPEGCTSAVSVTFWQTRPLL